MKELSIFIYESGDFREALDVSMKKNNSNEVGFFWNLNNLEEVFVIKGSQKSITMSDTIVRNWIKTAPKYSIVVMHNHPRNGLFSGADLKSFVDYVSIYAMTAVCNDGTIYTIYKTSEFDPIALMVYYNIGIQKGGNSMANSFLPLGYQPQSEEEMKMTEEKEKLYEYYGIHYGVIDGSKEDENNIEKEKDRTTAQILIMQGKTIPSDLEERLLQYKENEGK